MATRPHIFNRLRSLSVEKGQSLNALIEEACEIGGALLELLQRYRNETPLGHQPHMIAHQADAAIARAYGNGHTPDNGAKVA